MQRWSSILIWPSREESLEVLSLRDDMCDIVITAQISIEIANGYHGLFLEFKSYLHRVSYNLKSNCLSRFSCANNPSQERFMLTE